MSTFKAEVVRVGIEPHPNADRLDVARVKGWACVVRRGEYQDKQLAVYVPLDAVLPDAIVKAAGIEKYYNKRLRSQKLRGIVSQGLVLPISVLNDNGELPLEEGDDVTRALGVTKYDPPIPVHMSGQVRSMHPKFEKYTDIENIKNYPNVLVEGEEVIITEKVHGTNFRAGRFDGELHVGSRSMSLKEDPGNLYWRAAEMLGLKDKLAEGEIVFGEIYGSGVQDLAYGKKPGEIAVVIFDVFSNGVYLDSAGFQGAITAYGWLGLEAPVIYRGPWSNDLTKLAAGNSTLCPGQIREGIVIRPVRERWGDLTGRVILKSINDDYLCRRDATEFH